MKKMGDSLSDFVSRLAGRDVSAADALRRAAVLSLWEEVVNAVFKEAASLVLDHTNAVYIMSGEKAGSVRRFDRPASETRHAAVPGNVLVVYVDDSMVRSELDNRQELLVMKMREAGENVELFKIIPSMRDMKHRHPYREDIRTSSSSGTRESSFNSARSNSARFSSPRVLSQQEKEEVKAVAGTVEDERISRAFEKAMTASKKAQNGEKEEI